MNNFHKLLYKKKCIKIRLQLIFLKLYFTSSPVDHVKLFVVVLLHLVIFLTFYG